MVLSAQQQNSLLGSTLALVATMTWAGNFIAGKILVHSLSSIEINFWRWSIAALCMLFLSYQHLQGDWPIIKKEYKLLIFYGVFGMFFSNILFYNAPKTASAVDMSILMTTSPIFMMFFAALLFKDQIKTAHLMGSAIAIFGVVTLVTRGNYLDVLHMEFTVGHFWTLGCSMCFALYSVCLRYLKSGMHLTVFLQVIFTISALCGIISMLFVPQLNTDFFYNTDTLMSILYIACGASLVSFLSWNKAIEKIGAVRAGMIYYLVPVFSAFWAIIILNETVSLIQVIGGAFVLCGVIFSSLSTHKKVKIHDKNT